MLKETILWLPSLLWAGMSRYTVLFLITLIVLYIIHWTRERHYKHTLFARLGIPYIKPHLLYGSMHTLHSDTLATDIMENWIKEHGKVFGFYIGETPNVVIADLDLIKQVLIKDFHNFSNRPKLPIEAQPVVDTIVGLRDQRWKDVRSILAPTFSMMKMKSMTGIMNRRVDEFLQIVSEGSLKNEPLEWYTIFQGLTLDVISECALAMKTHCQRDQNNDELFVAVRSFLKNALNPAIFLAVYFNAFAKIFSFISNQLALSGRMTNMIVSHLKTVIRIRRKDMSKKYIDVLQLMLEAADTQNPNEIEEDSPEGGTAKHSETRKQLTDAEIIANAWVFLLGGFETTANSLTSAAYLLACNPEVQERLYKELSSDIEDGSQHLTYETVNSLTYLDQVLSETLRIYPPVVSFMSRDTANDTMLGDYFIPSDTNIVIPMWHIHHNPEFWPDPEKFDPDRFSSKTKASENRHPMSYIPFGAGPRSCVGIRFAQLEAKLALARLIRCFKLETCEETVIPMKFEMPTVTHIPATGVMLKATPRQ
ncbi:cytochrome P450 3A25-like [Palaemon carinicauda]|uniref:cytochrome P450 3A25-like n=1 Tax=Palaemon carinicauda TaxID=392227 RepID=UPI0035B5CFE0